MEIVTAALLIVVIILLVNTKSDLNNKLAGLEQQVANLKALLQKALEQRPATPAEKPAETMRPQAEEKPRMVPAPEPPKPPTPEPPRPEPAKPQPTVEWDKQVIAPTEQAKRPAPPVFKQPEPRPSFFESHPDLEKFIGENLINKIGIAILVLAIAYFVKFAIDNNWIGPVGRVAVGMLCGSILIGFAHRLRKNYTAFSSVLAGGGLAIYYFTITLAFHQFHLFSQTVSLVILIGITLFAVALALLYDKQELGIIALVGGMSSPFMVSTGQANYNGLFIYLLILNTGLLIIAYYKAWRVMNISAFALTVLVFIAVLFSIPTSADAVVFLYASLFYLLFFAINIANNVKEGKAFIASDYSILLINTALYFAAGLYLLTDMHHEAYRGLFSAALGAINLVLSFVLFRNKKVDTNILYLLIGITLTFISLTAPIQLHGNNITLFWASEAVLLYWLFQRSNIKLMKLTALVVWLLMLGSLGIDLIRVYTDSSALTVMANKGFITTLCAAVSTYLLYLLVRRDTPEQQTKWGIDPSLLQGLAFVLLFLSGALEINHQFLYHYPDTALNIVYLMLYTSAFIWLVNLLVLQRERNRVDPRISAGLLAAAIFIYLIFIFEAFTAQRLMLEKHQPAGIHFMAHWLAAVFIGMLFYKLIIMLRDVLDLPDIFSWVICAGIVSFLSFEVCLISNQLFFSTTYSYDRVITVYIQTGLPVLWGLLSFGMMWLGMRNKNRTLRIISLSLFTLTLIKLFVFDIRDIPAAGKIAAFFCLGVLLLIVSFMYQKVKKIIADDETTGHNPE